MKQRQEACVSHARFKKKKNYFHLTEFIQKVCGTLAKNASRHETGFVH